MPAVPKRKHSKGRRDRRRSQDRLTAPILVPCPKCKAMKLPHYKCPNCGFYGSIDSSKPEKAETKPAAKKATASSAKSGAKSKAKTAKTVKSTKAKTTQKKNEATK